jgi:cell division protease FtsH
MDHLDRAKDKIMMGTERRSMVMSEKDKKLTAFHEAGHAIVGRLVPEHDPVYKVTIIPRGLALGVTMFLPEQDKYSISKLQLESQLASLFGGRVAEEIVFGAENVTTGASNDIERATSIARNMVTKWGLTEKLGPLVYSEDEDEVFLGRSITQHKHVSDDTARRIDAEVREIIDVAHEKAKSLLDSHLENLHLMADALIRYETINGDQIDQIMEGREPDPPADWQDSEPGISDSKDDASDTGDRTSIGGPAEQV